jgi:molybdopterin synthase catalytic subunit
VVTLLYFAAARERTGLDREELELGGQTVGAVVERLRELHPALAEVLPHCRVAVNQAFANDDDVVPDGAELALIPPVAGGDDVAQPAARARVLTEPLAVDPVLDLVAHAGAGAQVVMIGTVRDHAAGVGVERLEYEAYVPMAEKVIAEIVDEVDAQFPGVRTAVHHRTGDLAIGDRAVVVAASAPHRKDAFAACARVIDRLKEDAPIWKREHREGGVLWVGLGP